MTSSSNHQQQLSLGQVYNLGFNLFISKGMFSSYDEVSKFADYRQTMNESPPSNEACMAVHKMCCRAFEDKVACNLQEASLFVLLASSIENLKKEEVQKKQ